jgi:hypothetical protein
VQEPVISVWKGYCLDLVDRAYIQARQLRSYKHSLANLRSITLTLSRNDALHARRSGPGRKKTAAIVGCDNFALQWKHMHAQPSRVYVSYISQTQWQALEIE